MTVKAPEVKTFTIAYDQKPLTSSTTQWMAFDKVTGDEVIVLFDVISKCVVSMVDHMGDPYECDIERLVSSPPFEYTPDNNCATEWEKKYLSKYTDFHKQVVGPTGVIGTVGPVGNVGAQGGIGPTGERGEIGIQGPVGEVGKTGANGRQGTTGSNGVCGCLEAVTEPAAATSCPGTAEPSGFGSGGTFPGQLVLGPGESGSIRFAWQDCRKGALFYIKYGSGQFSGCSSSANFLVGTNGHYQGNVDQSPGAKTVNFHNPGSSPCSVGSLEFFINA